MCTPIFLSTDTMAAPDRNDYWREILAPFFDVRPPEPDTPLQGSLALQFFGNVSVGRASFNPQLSQRQPLLVARTHLSDFYLLQLCVRGTTHAQFPHSATTIQPGDVAVFDLARTWQSQSTAGETLSVFVERTLIDQESRGNNIHGLVLRRGQPLTVLLANFVVALSALPAPARDTERLAVEEATVAFLAATLARSPNTGAPPVQGMLRHAILRFIDANLARHDLGVALLLQKFAISRSQLYRIFTEDGGVAAIIAQKRLDAALRRILAAPATRSAINRIAYEFGFASNRQFHDLFQTRFGISPRDIAADRGPVPPVDANLHRISEYFKHLKNRAHETGPPPA